MALEQIALQKQFNGYTSKSLGYIHEYYLSGVIGAAEDYAEWFDTMRNAGANDVIKIYINSMGGDLFTAIQFMRVLTETDARVICSVEGMCMSAATIVFMCAEGYEVTPHSMFMFHNYSGGAFGKGGEMIDQLQHERKWSAKLLQEVYEDFLTPEEVEAILDNKDIWMDGEEVVDRLNIRIAKHTAEAEAAQKAAEEAAKPKSKPRKKPVAKKQQ